MTVDYDLIVLGGTPVGRYAAARAHQMGARVALIEPPAPSAPSPLLCSLLAQLNPILRQQFWLHHWDYNTTAKSSAATSTAVSSTAVSSTADSSTPASQFVPPTLNWPAVCQWAETLADSLEVSIASTGSLAQLAVEGIEIIVGSGSFYRRPELGFSVADRRLRGRAYLLALPTQSTVPAVEGLTAAHCITFDSLAQQSWPVLPQRLLILGNDPRGIALAQVFNRLGVQVTLITQSNRLLPYEDPEAAFLLQAQLEAEGVNLLTKTQLTQVRQLDQQLWVQAGDRAIQVEAILLATRMHLALGSLNLEAAQVKWHPQGIVVNRKLQTTHPRIYACGEGLGGYSLAAIDQHEANVAVDNALFFPTKQVDYQRIPWAIFTDPQLARIGLTESEARQRYGKAVLVACHPLRSLVKAQLWGETTGFCKLIAHRNGEILGAHCLGPAASEWIGPIALAMQQHLKLNALAACPTISPTWAELIQKTAVQYQHQHRPHWQRELLETWFNFRRSR